MDMQNQNPVERHHQHAKYLCAAVLVDQDLLSASFWGWAVIGVWRSLNAVTNTLTPTSTPMIVFENKITELEHQFCYPFGQPVICAKVGPNINGMSVTKNEFGVVVAPGLLNNGSSFVYFPSRGCRSVSIRVDMRPINLGMRPQMSLDDGKGYLPILNAEGSWTLVTRGDSSFLGKRFAEEMPDHTTSAFSDVDGDCFDAAGINSGIMGEDVLAQCQQHFQRYPVTPVPEEQFDELVIDSTTGVVTPSSAVVSDEPGTIDGYPPESTTLPLSFLASCSTGSWDK